MHRIPVISLLMVICFNLSAQTIALSGKVTNQSGKAIAGATVTLKSKNLTATTNAAGEFSIKGTGVNVSPILSGADAISLNNGSITVSLAKPAGVRIELFDLQGNLLERVLDNPASAGECRVDLRTRALAENMTVVRISIGQSTSTFRYCQLTNSTRASRSSVSSSNGHGLAKRETIADTLQASASGYTPQKIPITSYEATVDITLETANCTANPSKIVNQTVTGSGPNKVVIETNSDAGINKGTIFRPADLGPGKNYPIFLWGEGGCSQNGLSNKAAMGEIASWGYFIIADGTPGSGGAAKTSSSNMGDPKQFYGYLDWIFAQSRNPCSAYYQSLDTTKVAADGFSCGGLMSINASGDPRFTAIGYTSSGLFSADQALYKKIHIPIKILNGGPESAGNDMAYENGVRDYADMSKLDIKVLYYAKTSAGHGGDLNNGKGDFNTVNLAWLNWQLKGDTGATGKALLIGDNCKFCKNSGWEFKSANLD